MKTKTVIASSLIFLLAITSVAYALNNVTWGDDGVIKLNIKTGWNLIPLRLSYDTAGRYWSTYRAGQTTCTQDVAREVWMWSPVAGKYEFFVIDDWEAPNTRNNEFLQNEFEGQYYHAHLGSGWIYSAEDCVLAYDNTGFDIPYAGYSLSAMYSGSQDQPSKNYNFDDLVLKRGWNFIPQDTWMTIDKNYYNIFGNCEISKINIWNQDEQEWNIKSSADMVTAAQNMMEPSAPNIGQSDVFLTLLIKVENDCKISMTSVTSGPPAIPE
jgi:hypothetical protein